MNIFGRFDVTPCLDNHAGAWKTWIGSLFASTALLTTLPGCGTVDESYSPIDRAHAHYRMLEGDPSAAELSAPEMADARQALKAADESWARNDGSAVIDHLAYLAEQRVSIARETVSAKTSDGKAAAAKMGMVEDKAARDVATARSATQAVAAELAVVSTDARQEEALAAELTAQLNALGAKQTERGDVVTLGDVLFDTNRSDLRASGVRDLDKLVDFFNRHPKRKALIEGFTDSRGGIEANLELSQRRANALRNALVAHGVQAERLDARGYGEGHPTSDNRTALGRQMNRRVEVVLSDENGDVTGR